MDQFFIVNDITEEPRKKAILLSSCGAATYSLLRSLVAPAEPSDKNYRELIAVMNEHQIRSPSLSWKDTNSTKETDNRVIAFHLM